MVEEIHFLISEEMLLVVGLLSGWLLIHFFQQ